METHLDDGIGQEHTLDPSITERNLLTSILTKPYLTMQVILRKYPTKWVTGLIAFGAIRNGAEQAMRKLNEANGDLDWNVGFVIGTFVGSAVFGFLGFYLVAYLTKLVSRWFGGTATFKDALTVEAWAVVPQFAYIILYPAGAALGVIEMDVLSTESLPAMIGLLCYVTAVLIIGIWGIVIMIAGIRAANDFSVGRSIGVFFTIMGMIVVPIMLFAMLITLLN